MRTTSRKCDKGFTLIEILIYVTLLAVMMLAAAVAISSAFDAHQFNLEKTRTVSLARGALSRVMHDCRRAASVELNSDYSINIILSDGTEKTYSWSGTAGDPMTLAQEGLAGSPAVLVPNVESLHFTVEEEYDAELQDYKVIAVNASLELRTEKYNTTLHASTRPRRNIY